MHALLRTANVAPLAALALLATLAAGAGAAEHAPRVRLTTSLGDIVLELEPERAPISAENFLRYVNDGFYQGTVFHRVIPGFMVQGGGMTEDMTRKETREPILNEADNGLRNLRGTVAMARTGRPHSATAQFFINVADNDFLDHRSRSARGWGYAVFARVVDGMDVVDAAVSTPTGTRDGFKDVPRTPIVIRAAVLEPTDEAPAKPPGS